MEEKMYHIGLSRENLKGAKYAILPGDPGRVLKIARYMDNYEFLGFNREYNSYLGTLNGEKILIISTGMGGPSTAICVEELAQIGITHLIRIGTCGGMQLNVEAGDIVIATGAIRQEGTSKEYLPVEYPAVADFDLTLALRSAAQHLNFKTHLGVVQCKDSYYGQHNPERMPTSNELLNKWDAWIKGGALASEMETASLYITSSVLRLHASAVLLAVWNQEREKKHLDNRNDFDTNKAINVVIEALKNMISESR